MLQVTHNVSELDNAPSEGVVRITNAVWMNSRVVARMTRLPCIGATTWGGKGYKKKKKQRRRA